MNIRYKTPPAACNVLRVVAGLFVLGVSVWGQPANPGAGAAGNAAGQGQAASGNANAAGTPAITPAFTLPSVADLAKSVPVGGAANRKAVDDAKSLVKDNNVAAAEAALTKLSAFQRDTVDWHVETAQKLMATAHELARDGGDTKAPVAALATQSLQHLNQIATLSTDAKVKANAKAMSGFIQHRYSGDAPAAIASYKAALVLTPNDAAVKEALERLEKADAILRARIKPATKR